MRSEFDRRYATEGFQSAVLETSIRKFENEEYIRKHPFQTRIKRFLRNFFKSF